MMIRRREFLKMLGVTAGTAAVGGCGRVWEVPEKLIAAALRGPGLESHRQTLCGLCEAGCGVSVRLVDGLPVGLKGNANHPLNRGGLCPVGQAGLEVLYAPQRIQGPLRRSAGGGFESISWEGALEEIGDRLSDLAERGESSRIVLVSGEQGRFIHELAERFSSAMGSSIYIPVGEPSALAYALSQGIEEAPGFDLSECDLVFSFGLDLFEGGPAPLHAVDALVGSRATEARARVLHVGTRLSPSAAVAEKFVRIEPGTHGAFALGVAHVLVREGNYDRRFVEEHTFGFEDETEPDGSQRLGFRRLLLERYYPDRAAQLCGCEPAIIVEMARRFAAASRPVALTGGEALGGTNATWTAMAVHALNALSGAFGREGGVLVAPSIPLAPLPATESATERVDEPATFSSRRGGLEGDPVEALAEGVLDGSRPVEVLIVAGANPVYTSPAGHRLREAMQQIPLVVAVTPFQDETAAAASFVLPAHVPFERWQATTTPSTVAFSTLGIGEPVIEPLFDSRDPADVLLTLAHRVAGVDESGALPWETYEDYLKDRVQGLVVSGEGSVVTGSFEESWASFLQERGWRFLEHRSLDSLWKDLVRESAWWNPVRAKSDWERTLPTPSGRFEFFSRRLEQHLERLGRESSPGTLSDGEALAAGVEAAGLGGDLDEICLPHFEPPILEGDGDLTLIPFQPITGRGAWAAVSPMVMEMYGCHAFTEWQTWVELAPETAHELHLEDGDEVAVESDRAAIEAVVRVQPGSIPGAAHVPTGLGHLESFGANDGTGANPMEVLVGAHDTLTGARSWTSTRVRLRLLRRRAHGGPAPLYGEHV